MPTPRAATFHLVALIFFCASFSIYGPSAVVYARGDAEGAISALILPPAVAGQNKDGADALLQQGLALFRQGKLKDARQAFAEAVKLRPGFAEAHANLAYVLLELDKPGDARDEARKALASDTGNALAHFVLGTLYARGDEASKALEEAEAALKTREDFRPALLLKGRALVSLYGTAPLAKDSPDPIREESRKARRLLLLGAADSLEKYLQTETNPAEAEVLREQLETLRFYAEQAHNSNGKGELTLSQELTTRVRITDKPEPPFTDAARNAHVRGRVVLQAVFGSDGKVRRVLVLRGLPFGLTEKAVEAARKIKFTPATKDGRPVSVYYRIEYNFVS